MHTALTIAGSDSSGGAGIQADLKTFAALGVYGASAITAITAQNTLGIVETEALAADLVTAQIEAVAGDFTIEATKIGMLATAAIVEAVAAAIEELELPLVVLDPVLMSTGGECLLDADGVEALRRELIPRARVITPNIPEAEALSGTRIVTRDDVREAARRLHDMGAAAVIITGGHAPWNAFAAGAHGDDAPDVVDLVLDAGSFHECRVPRVTARTAHGTGCTFASAVAACLALGHTMPEAAARAQQYVAGALAHAPGVAHAARGRGLLHHFWGGILKG
jgi:hydroxymethylpyrimidine/phosphomethylpyrimidine kinase